MSNPNPDHDIFATCPQCRGPKVQSTHPAKEICLNTFHKIDRRADQSVREQMKVLVRKNLNDAFDYGSKFNENWAEEDDKTIENINVVLDLMANRCIILLDQISAEREDAGYKRGLKAAEQEVAYARKLQETYLAVQGAVVPMKIMACKHCAEKIQNGEPIEAPALRQPTGEDGR